MKKRFWLLKSEPSTFSIDDLAHAKQQTTDWDGVRNYTARNTLRDEMQVGDLGFFYHSSCPNPSIVGIVEIVSQGAPDRTAFDPQSPYFDPKSTASHPRWFSVKVKLKQKFSHPVSLATLRASPQFASMVLLRKGNRLSVMPVIPEHWEAILAMAR